MRMHRRGTTRIVLFLLVLTHALYASAVETARSESHLAITPQSGDIDVIIEFRTEPLLHKTRSGWAAGHLQKLAIEVERLEEDLERLIDGSSSETGAEPARVRHRYVLTFAGASARVPRHAIPEIAGLDYVARVVPDREFRALLEESVPFIGAPEVWSNLGARGEGVTVAVLDSGIAYTHQAFGGTIGPGSRVRGGFDFANDDPDPMDDHGHGTHVAGIIGGNGGGVTGVAPAVSFLAYKVLNQQGSGSASDIIAAIERSVDPDGDGDPSDRADVVNMSLGGPPTQDDPIVAAVESATTAGVLFVVAAGNSSVFFGLGSPAVAPSALAVGASNRSDDGLASFSSRGPVQGTGMLKPEVVAPGVSIVSASPDGGLFQASGTSMAAPHVAGVAALVKQIHPEFTPERIKSALVNTAVRTEHETMAGGAGRVDAFAATSAMVTAEPSVISFGVDDLTVDEWTSSRSIRIHNTSGRELNLAATITGADANIVMAVDPPTLSIPAGETGDITVGLSVANGAFPTPREGSLSFGGHVLLEDGDVRLNLPWAFVKAARAQLRFGQASAREVLVSSSSRWDRFLSGSDGLDVILPPDTYDIVAESGFGAAESAVVIVEHQAIPGPVTIDANFDSATTVLTLEARDQRDEPLRGREDRQCSNVSMLLLPEGSDREWWTLSHQRSLRISPASARFRLLPAEFCSSPSALWMAQHDPIVDLSRDVTSTLGADRWITQSVYVVAPEGFSNLSLSVLGLLEWRGARYPGAGGYFRSLPVERSSWTGEIHLTGDLIEGTGAAMLLSMTTLAGGPAGGTLVDTPSLRPTESVVSPIVHATPGPLSYVPRVGETLRFGVGTVFPETFIGVTGGRILATLFWRGLLEELRLDVSSEQQLTVTFPDGTEVRTAGSRYSTNLTDDGLYVLESRTPLRLGFVAGEERLTARFDSRQFDNVTPTLTGVRILDHNERARSIVGTTASLVFSVADNARIPEKFGVFRAAVPPHLVRAWARPHGTSNWQALSVTHLEDDVGDFVELGHVATGSVFRADLSSVTSSSGLFDIRIEAADASGNSMEFVSSPAFSAAPERRRPVRR